MRVREAQKEQIRNYVFYRCRLYNNKDMINNIYQAAALTFSSLQFTDAWIKNRDMFKEHELKISKGRVPI